MTEIPDIVLEAVIKTTHKKKEMQKDKMIFKETLQIAEKKRSKMHFESRVPFECRVLKNSKER